MRLRGGELRRRAPIGEAVRRARAICTCAATPRMRVRISFCRPFITDRITISAHTPRPMPIIDTAELTPTKRLRRRARV